MTRPSPTDVAATGAALASAVVLVALWHALGLAGRSIQAGYPLSQYFSACISWSFAVTFVIVSGILGWTFRRAWSVAVGMLVALPVAVVIEMVKDPTSHNLIPIEVLLYWVPIFLLAFAGARAGQRLRRRAEPSGAGALAG